MSRTCLLILVLMISVSVFAQTGDTPFQIHYAANLDVNDSVIDITNSGASGASLLSGTGASETGALCANVYVFDPTEEEIACCSCPVTPNGLVSLSVKNDLISNTLTPSVPKSVVVKRLATVPVGEAATVPLQMPQLQRWCRAWRRG